jgi:small subunit ribosomal protein S1
VTGTITKIAPFGAFARIEDGIEGLIHQSELSPGMDPRANLREGQELQLRILRIDAERRRLGLSLRQANEVDARTTGETPSGDSGTNASTGDMMSLEQSSSRGEESHGAAEKEGGSTRREGRAERRERPERAGEHALLNNITVGNDEGETTAMAEAFKAAARQRSKDESEAPEE